MTQGLSVQSMTAWESFAQGVAGDASAPLDRELLDQFLIGVHRRGEELSAHELKTLVERLEVSDELRQEVMGFVGPAMGLLEAYDRSSPPDPHDDDDEDEPQFVEDDDFPPGILVI